MVLDDATMVPELRAQYASARDSFMGTLVRMRHEGIDMVIIVHNRGNVSPVIKNSATIDTLFDPRSRADKTAVAEQTSGLSEKGLEQLVKAAMGSSQHGTVSIYKGRPMDSKYVLNFNTYAVLGWDEKEAPTLEVPTEPPEPEWAPPLVMKYLPAGQRLLRRLRDFERNIDPDREELGKGLEPNNVLATQRVNVVDEAHKQRERKRRRYMGMFNAFES
jgi:hypothetical protein